MSPTEAVMWRISNDPWLRPIAGGLAVVDRPIDSERFRHRVGLAVADVTRLRERVEPGPLPWEPPRWVPDTDFDLDYHVRRVALAGRGSEAELRELVSHWYEDPLDPARPLWQFVIVDGVEGNRGALFSKLHHSISDGIGLLRLSERYVDLERDPPEPPDADPDDRFPADRSVAGSPASGGGPSSPRPLAPVHEVVHLAARSAGWPLLLSRRAVT
jgi:diacylglycerol O-acyltransferase / wax synthase